MNEVISFLIHGSIVRSKIDEFSDRDCLIISNQRVEDIPLYHKLKSYYWNCSVYSTDKINYLLKTNSLFLKHLKEEGIILVDENDYFLNVLANYKQKDNYKQEWESNLATLAKFLVVPRGAEFAGFFIDMFYVIVRNAFILGQGSKDINFSFQQYSSELFTQGKIDKNELDVLEKLRGAKFLYRKNPTAIHSINEDYLNRILQVLNKVFDLRFEIRKTDTESALAHYYDLAFKFTGPNYIRLRAFEYLYNFHVDILENEQVPIELLSKAILEPVNYKSTFFEKIKSVDEPEFIYSN